MGTSLVVKAQAKNLAKYNEKPLNVSADFYQELNKKAELMIKEACKRAKLNGRNTVMGKDV